MAFFHFQNYPDASESAVAPFKKQAQQRAVKYASPMLRKDQE
jgi:hypothetical protein